jgi:hypothetical protein
MNEHTYFEVVGAEHRCDAGQVHANVISRRVVMISYGVDFDDAAVREKRKVVNRGFIRKPHCTITPAVHAGCTFIGPLSVILRYVERK